MYNFDSSNNNSFLSEYLEDLSRAAIVEKLVNWSEELSYLPILNVSYDSRTVGDACLFLCKGRNFKREYLLEAIDNGAIAYVASKDQEVAIPGIIVNDIRKSLSLCAERYYRWPQKDLSIIGITGTKGKTSSCVCLKSILDHWLEKQNLPAAGLISSMYNFDGKSKEDSVLTTPEPLELYKILRNCVDTGVHYLIMESSSQGLKYGRTAGINFSYASILNISIDHISALEHANFADYYKSKLSIIDQCDNFLINLDSKYAPQFIERAKGRTKSKSYSIQNIEADYAARGIKANDSGLVMDVVIKEKNKIIKDLEVSLHGRFNASNALLATAIAVELGADQTSIREGLKQVELPGRMTLLATEDKAILVLVDYAHNKLSFEAVFDLVEEDYPEYNKIAIFGSVGERAINRRSEISEIAGKRADFVYLTSDNIAYESFDAINADMIPNLEKYACPWEADPVRENCIKKAFMRAKAAYDQAGKKSIILALGISNDSSMYVQGKNIPIKSDVAAAKEQVELYNNNLTS